MAQNTSPTYSTAFQLARTTVRVAGPKAVPVKLPFSADTVQKVDLSTLQNNSNYGTVGGIFIDNSGTNSDKVTLNTGAPINQTIVIPGGSQAYLPLLTVAGTVLTFTASAAIDAQIQLLNFVPSPEVWGVNAIGAAVSITGNVSVIPVAGGITNASSALVAAGVAQTLVAANAARKRLVVSNPSTPGGQNIVAAESLFIWPAAGVPVDGATGIEIFPGQTWTEDSIAQTSSLWSINAATIGHRYRAWEQ